MKKSIDCRQIEAVLEHEPRINLHRNCIQVSCLDNIVQLKGEVGSIVTKRLAVHIVKSIQGVEGVDDELRVTPTQSMGDDAIVDNVIRTLSGEPVFREYEIRKHTHFSEELKNKVIMVHALDGVVRLAGAVESLSHKRLADVLIWWTSGVADVDNRLRVYPSQKDNDYEMDDSLRMVLEKDPCLDQDEIHVQTRDHVVHLSGVVHNETEKQLAEKDAWCILGVHDVHNDLEIRA